MTLAIGWPHEVGENLKTWPREGGVWHSRSNGAVCCTST